MLARQSNKQFDVFSETNNIAALKKCAATTQNGFARELASNALRLMNQTVPVKLSNQVHFWDTEDVAIWFEINGFKATVNHSDTFIYYSAMPAPNDKAE